MGSEGGQDGSVCFLVELEPLEHLFLFEAAIVVNVELQEDLVHHLSSFTHGRVKLIRDRFQLQLPGKEGDEFFFLDDSVAIVINEVKEFVVVEHIDLLSEAHPKLEDVLVVECAELFFLQHVVSVRVDCDPDSVDFGPSLVRLVVRRLYFLTLHAQHGALLIELDISSS